jgi:hypothetical protein
MKDSVFAFLAKNYASFTMRRFKMRTYITVITILIMARLCFGGTGDVVIHLNGGEDVAYIGDTTTIEVWIKNDADLQALSMPFKFSIGRNYQFISSGALGY